MPSFQSIVDRNEIVSRYNDWQDTQKFVSEGRIVDQQGESYIFNGEAKPAFRLLAKKERAFSLPERIGRLALGLFLTVFSFGFGLMARYVQNLYIKTKVTVRLAIPFNSTPTERKRVVLTPDLPGDKIRSGYGEYVLFYNPQAKEKAKLSKETFERAYAILNRYAPTAVMNQEEYVNRYNLIQNELKKIDQDLEAAFIPRTLYELIFVRKCIKEDLKENAYCHVYSPFAKNVRRKCWHLACFDNAGDNNHSGVREAAFRLNQAIVKKLAPQAGGFKFEELSKGLENELDFFKDYFKKCNDKVYKLVRQDGAGPVVGFAYDYGVFIKSTAIGTENEAQIVRNAFALECSKKAQFAVFLYRGSNFNNDWPVTKPQGRPFSLSYGSGLFAGVLFDSGACAFHYLKKDGCEAIAHAVPIDQFQSSPFYVPPTNALCQLFGRWEIFHGRSKVWEREPNGRVGGVQSGEIRTEHLVSNLGKEELVKQYRQHKVDAIFLK